MRQRAKEIKAVLHLPESEHAIRRFEKKICDFYTNLIEQKLRSLPKENKLAIIDVMIEGFNK